LAFKNEIYLRMKNNFLIKQYLSDKKMKIRHNYLSEQFKSTGKIFKLILDTVKFNDFTLGRYVNLFEKKFCKYQKVKYALGVGSGTDAIFLSFLSMRFYCTYLGKSLKFSVFWFNATTTVPSSYS
jgi:hypothetical protein